jgi:hypothetical protein
MKSGGMGFGESSATCSWVVGLWSGGWFASTGACIVGLKSDSGFASFGPLV